jgi:hypothetical protein
MPHEQHERIVRLDTIKATQNNITLQKVIEG